MILVINYANEPFRQAQIICTAAAQYFGADKVLEYSPKNIPLDFYAAHKDILDQPRGNGYWLWKPFIVLDALNKVNDGDYVFYMDSGSSLVDDVHLLINAMEQAKTNIMVFVGPEIEKVWTKRDAFILMDCDSPEYADTPQIGATYVLLKKCNESIEFVKQWLHYMTDARIVTDMPNQMGKENYPEFMENRHDQSCLSLLVKKHKLPLFRNPSEYGLNLKSFSEDVISRSSSYSQITYSHRRKDWTINSIEYLKLYPQKPNVFQAISSVLYLMHEKLYNEALSVLLRISEKNMKGGGLDQPSYVWSDLMKILYLSNEAGVVRGQTIEHLVYVIMLHIFNKNVPVLVLIESIDVAKRLENKTGEIEVNLRNRIINYAISLVQQVINNPNTAAWLKNSVNDILKYLVQAGYIKLNPPSVNQKE